MSEKEEEANKMKQSRDPGKERSGYKLNDIAEGTVQIFPWNTIQ